MITCEEPAQGPAQDSTPPELAAEIGTVEVSDNTISFTATNPNKESIRVSIVLDPPAPDAVFMIGTETFAALDGAVIEASAVGNITITNLTNDVTYTFTITTQDSAGNPHSSPVTAAETPRETFPYLCVNGMPPAERSFTENQVRCGTCDADYGLVTDETTGIVTCERVYSFICNNGTPTSGTTSTDGVMSCQRCISGFALDSTDNTCNPVYICENGTPAPGIAPAPNTPGCSECIDNYHIEDNICQPNRYACEGGTPRVVGENEDPPAAHETVFCTACDERYRDGGNNTCLANSYTCQFGTAAPGMPIVHQEERCTTGGCDDFYHIDNNVCVVNTYSCDGGTASTGRPTVHETTFCTECNMNTHTLVGNVCNPNGYACPGGTPASGSPATNGEVRCSACDTSDGYRLIGTASAAGSSCAANTYSCDGGVATAGRPAVHETVSCTANCFSGYTFDSNNNVCVAHTYTCPGGTPAEGRPVVDGTVMCTACNTGYRDGPSNTCLANAYTCENGNPAPGRPAVHETNRCDTCSMGYHRVDDMLTGNHTCETNTFVCTGTGAGNPVAVLADGSNRPATDGLQNCASCLASYHQEAIGATGRNTCAINTYSCDNGDASTGAPAMDGTVGCLRNGCDSGYYHVSTGRDVDNNVIGRCAANVYTCANGQAVTAGTEPDVSTRRHNTTWCRSCNANYGLMSNGTCRTLGSAVKVGTLTTFGLTGSNAPTRPSGMIHFNGRVYMVDRDRSRLYTLNITTGRAARVGNVDNFGITNLRHPNGLALHNGTVYMSAGIPNQNPSDIITLFRLDTGSDGHLDGTATRIGSTVNFGASEWSPQGLASVTTSGSSHLYLGGENLDRLLRISHTTAREISGSIRGAHNYNIGEQYVGGLGVLRCTNRNDVLYMVGGAKDYLSTVAIDNTSSSTHGRATRVGNSTQFGVSENSPYGLVFVGTTLYMTGWGTDSLYELAYSRNPKGCTQ